MSTVTSDVVYDRGLDFFTAVVERMSPGDWQRPSPCEGWRALDVLGHIGAATSMGTAILRGDPMEMSWPEPPGDSVSGDPAGWWSALQGPAHQALQGADLDAVVDSPNGPRPVREGLAFPAVDLFVHAWDIARSAKQAEDIEIPDDVIDFTYEVTGSVPEDLLRSSNVFGPAVTPPADASRSEELLAWTGRDPAATPPLK